MLPDSASPSKRKFKLLKRIGVGGFGEVYLAELQTNSGFAKTVALKLLRADVAGGDEMATRIRDEARLLGMMRHRSIVQADDLINLAGRPTVVMEFIPGVNLNWLLNPNRFREEIPPSCGFEIIRHVADALDVAYSRPSSITGRPLEVLHRDIKPANIRITPDGEVKVLDFGIARSDHMERESQTQDYNLGSLRYMAPEMLLVGKASPASDIYSLGVTAFETISRIRFGLAGDSNNEHSNKIRNKFSECDTRPLGDHADEALGLLRSMVAFDPEDRPSAREVMKLCQELEKVVDGGAMWEWAPEAIPKVTVPDDEEVSGELTGQTLYEEPSERLSGTYDRAALEAAVAASASSAAPPSGLDPDRTRAEPRPAEPAPAPEESGGGWRVIALLGLALGAAALLVFTQQGDETRAPAGQPTVQPVAETQESQDIAPAEAATADATAADPGAEAAVEGDGTAATDAESAVAGAGDTEPAQAEASAAQDPPKAEAKPAEDKPKAEAKPAEPKPKQPKTSAAPVKVKLVSSPFGIAVMVDGKSYGKTPTAVELSPGQHTLLFVDGESSIRKTVTVKAGEENKFTYRRTEGAIR